MYCTVLNFPLYIKIKIIFCFYENHPKTLFLYQRTQTSLTRLQDVSKRSRGLTTNLSVVTTSGKRRLIYEIFKTSDLRRLEDVWFTTSWDVWFTTSCGRPLYVVLKTSNLRRLEDIWLTTSWVRLIHDVLKTSDLRRLEVVQFKTSSRRL